MEDAVEETGMYSRRKYYFQYCDSNIRLFSIAPCFITLNRLCILQVSVLCFFFDGSLSKIITLPTIEIVVALKGDSGKIIVTFR